MGKVLVLYHSKDGNTRKMAGLVAEGAAQIPETEIRVRPVSEAVREDILWCDGIALGSHAIGYYCLRNEKVLGRYFIRLAKN
jgi:NAD(P)H dehydrogenase (quinone)